MLRYTLTYNDDVIVLKGADSPANVDGFTLALTRDETYHSVLVSYTISDKLQGDGKKWLDAIVKENGWNVYIRADVAMFDGVQYFDLVTNGKVNLRNWSLSEDFTQINIENGSFESNIMNRDESEINLISNKDLNGLNISNYLTPASDIYLRGTGTETTQRQGYLIKDAFAKAARIITGSAYPINEDASSLIMNDKRAISLGRMLRGYENVDFPIKFRDLFKSISVQSCIGMGFIRDLDTKIYFDTIETFYPQVITAELTNISNLEYSYDEDLIFTKLVVGYQNFEKKENINGQSEYNGKAYYNVPISHFDKEKQLISPYRADGLSIEALKTKGISDENDNLDNEIFIIDCVEDENGNLVNRKNEEFQTISGIYSNLELFSNLLYSPARIIKNWGAWLAIPFQHDTTKSLLFQKNETQTKLATKFQGEDNETIDGLDISATNLENPLLTGRIIRFDCTFDAETLRLIIAAPNGLIKFYDYINKITNFGYIKEVNITPVDKTHNVELYEAKDVPEIENIGYILKEDGSPLLFENGSLIQLEYKMAQTPTKISALPPKASFDDDDIVLITNNGYNYQTTGATIKASISAETEAVETYTLLPDAEKIINLGVYGDYKTYYVNYTANRDTRFRAGLFTIKAFSPSEASISDSGTVIVPDTFGETGGFLSIAADVNSNQVRLKITTDDADATNTSLFIKVTKMV